VTTDKQMIADFLRLNSASAGRQDTNRIQLVFCTYKVRGDQCEAYHAKIDSGRTLSLKARPCSCTSPLGRPPNNLEIPLVRLFEIS
jgi:hypothetical protein